MSSNKTVASGLMQQYSVQRKNLLFACRLAVKSLIDKACMETVDETSEELQNFCVILEHILCHQLKAQQKWYGGNDVRSFWEYIRMACNDVKNNCLKNVKSLEKPRTSQGKGRAWIRVALMEKRLSDYLSVALQQVRLTRNFYAEGAVMLTDEMQVLTGVLLGLNAIDFSFDIRSEDLDQPYIPVINFTPYLRYVHIQETVTENVELQELSEMSTSVVSDVFGDDDPTDTWPSRFSRLDNKYRLVVEQKGYLEELVRLRESQLTEVHGQKQKLVETMQHYETESRKDRQQLESVIIELQAQLSQLKEEQWAQRERLNNVVVRYQTDPPNTSFHSAGDAPPNASTPGKEQHSKQQDFDQPSSSTYSPKESSAYLEAGDCKSTLSSASTLSAITMPSTNDDSHSMIPLAGSFTSETSFKSGEVTAPINDTSGQHPTAGNYKETSDSSTSVGPKSEVGSNQEEADRKEIVKVDICNSSDPASPPSDQSSQKSALSNVDNSSNPQEPKRDFDTNDPVDSGKKRLDSEKQEREGMEKGDEEKPVNA